MNEKFSLSDFRRLDALEKFLSRGDFWGIPPERLLSLRREFHALYRRFFALSAEERRAIQRAWLQSKDDLGGGGE
ncbi:MAG: hypothetical protein RMJ98_23315 [Myxococcales bacterium]|nr:hypothetical protein [Myxococcales bacterium]